MLRRGARGLESAGLPTVGAFTGPRLPHGDPPRGDYDADTRCTLTELLDKAVEAIRRMPAADQDTIAQAILGMTDTEIDPDHLRDALEALAEVERGAFATEEEIAAAFRSFER